ncbi:MAG TPA: tripartite tricarboxylate transporter permease [Firmicutes bacterium]|nr:tripartite tricarboxylate transporter permease [Bacillota bacterium]
MLDNLLIGFQNILIPSTLLIMIGGVILGIIFGAMPGLSATMAVALCLPLSYSLDIIPGVALLIALYIGGISGGLISAILLKIPGTPSSVATTFDGAPLAEKGEAGKALGVGVFFSFLGTAFSFIALVFIAPLLADFALMFGYFEYCAVAIFSLSLVASLVEGSLWKGLASAVIGFTLTMVGTAPIDGYPRFTFGIAALGAGFDILPALIGFFAVTEIFEAASSAAHPEVKGKIVDFKIKGLGFTGAEFKSQIPNMIRSTLIGIGIGILPGIGGGTSNLLAYATAKNQSKYPEKFGTGIIDGVVASETANNATIGGALIPLLSLGIPGDTTTAMLLGGLTLQGVAPGPLLFAEHGDVVYSIFVAVLVADIMMLILEFVGMRLFVRVLQVPKNILLSCVMALCAIGAFGVNNRSFDVITIFFFGLMGYAFNKVKIPTTPFILGFVLGSMVETNLRRGMMMTMGDVTPLFTKPICVVFLLLAVFSIIRATIVRVRQTKRERAGMQ